MRNTLSSMLASDPDIRVAGTARHGAEAVEKAAALRPDVITMDVDMPGMDGIEAVRQIMAECPAPVIMVSSLTTEGAEATFNALDAGAVDYIPKNLSELSVDIVKIKEVLIAKVKALAAKKPRAPRPAAEPKPAVPAAPASWAAGARRVGLVSIGSSLGGPKALQEVLSRLPKDFPVPIVIAQHMPAAFTGPFAERLNQMSSIRVKEAEEGEPLRAGTAFLSPGRGHMGLVRGQGIETLVSISEKNDEFFYRPSVDHLMNTAAVLYPGRTLGVIMTGMGSDGLQGARALKLGGCRIFCQDEETCVVYGMPRAVVEAGLADKVLPLQELAGEIVNAV